MSEKIKCKKCQTETSAFARTCPNCGEKINSSARKNASIIFGILGVFVIIGFIMLFGGNHESANTLPQTQNGSWNTKDVDAMTNGNVPLAAGLLKSSEDTKANAIDAVPAEVIKTPQNYYGKILKFSGSVMLVQDYKAGSEFSKIFGGKSSSEIAILTKDQTIIDMFIGIPRGTVMNGDTVTLYGYPVGKTVIAGSNGTAYPRLIMVGNAFDK